MAPKTVFVSYSSRDRRDAFEIKALLESAKIKVWLDYFDIQTTAELRQELAKKVKEANLFCLILSPTAVDSRWVNDEIETALAAAKDGLRILPILLRPCRIPQQLDNIVGFDASEGLKHEAVRLRLLRAVCGEGAASDKLLLDAANRLLIANRETLARAEQELPAINEKITPFVDRPIRNISLIVHPETLPDNPNIILEVELHIDKLYHGTMSFCIARYREGQTWPEDWALSEPPYTDYFLTDRARLDAQFIWLDRLVRLRVGMDGTETRSLPPIFTISFDGERFKPKGNPVQNFEIPSLAKLEKEKSRFRLIAHDVSQKTAEEISGDTDIDIAVLTDSTFDPALLGLGAGIGAPPIFRGGSIQGQLCLYSSRTTAEQRLISQTKYLQHVSSPIRRSILLQEYAGVYDVAAPEQEIADALKKGVFDTEEQRRMAARFRYSEAVFLHHGTQYEEAFAKLKETTDLLTPLLRDRTPSVEDASLAYTASRWMVDMLLQHSGLTEAGAFCDWMQRNAQYIAGSDPENADFQRILADAMRVGAGIHAQLGERERAADELQTRIAMHAKLYSELDSEVRRNDFLVALIDGARSAQEWKISELVLLKDWQEYLAGEIGEENADRITRPKDPNAVPRWLEECDPPGWPTEPLKSEALRYALRIPKRWATERQVRGTEREVEHVYRGAKEAEWLTVAFMDAADEGRSDMRVWVDQYMQRTGFPVKVHLKPEPNLRKWDYLGKLPGVAKKLAVDEAHAYTGLVDYVGGERPVLGRLYILMARRKQFAWKIALSFETACFEHISEARVYSQDHVRAGAILGALRLGSGAQTQKTGKRT
jgi:hypothetical protein